MTVDHVIAGALLIAVIAVPAFVITRAQSLRQRFRDEMDAVEGGRNAPVDRSRS